VNNARQYAYEQVVSGLSHAFLYSNGVAQYLSSYGIAGYSWGISDAGHVILETSGSSRWLIYQNNSVTPIVDPNDHSANGGQTTPKAVNAAGDVVGSYPDGTYTCYYTAHPQNQGADYCRTSRDLRTWSEPKIVGNGGQAGSGPSSAECPFVVELEPGNFYLFRTQAYGRAARCSVFFSHGPMDFGVDHDQGHFVCTLPIAAPEIIRHEGQYYVAALLPSLKGIQVARLEWATIAK